MSKQMLKSLELFNPVRHRKWITLDPSAKHVPESLKLRIMSFNMLNQSYMWPQIYNAYVKPEYRTWEYRFPLLRETIQNQDIMSDIMCFQEMEGRVYKQVWKPMMRDWGYGSEYIRKGKPLYWDKMMNYNSNNEDLIDGVSIFYDKSKFEFINSEKFLISKYFQDHFDGDVFGLDLNYEKIEKTFLPRNQVGLIVVLKQIESDEYIIVANTHLYWKNDDVKLLQIMVLLEALNKLKLKYSDAKILFTGDFNSKPQSSVYKFLKEDQLDINDPDISKYVKNSSSTGSHDGKTFKNPIKTSSNIFDKVIEQDGLFTCYTQHLFGIFDYIWFSDDDFRLLSFLSGVDTSYSSSINGLPNKDFPSDHIPIVAQFAINK